VLAYAGLCWPMLACAGLCWPVLAYAGLRWPVLACAGLRWPRDRTKVLAVTAANWCNVVLASCRATSRSPPLLRVSTRMHWADPCTCKGKHGTTQVRYQCPAAEAVHVSLQVCQAEMKALLLRRWFLYQTRPARHLQRVYTGWTWTVWRVTRKCMCSRGTMLQHRCTY